MPDIFDEVAEDLRRERTLQLWKRYGWVVVAACLLAIGGTGAWQAYTWQQRGAAETATARLLEVLRDPAAPASAATLDQLAREGAPGPRTLARLTDAARRVTAGDIDGALALWRDVAADTAADPMYRDLGRLLSAMHTLDTAEPAELNALLAPLAAPTNPWRHNAAELQALLAERRGDRAGAIAGFRALAADPAVPSGIRTRAAQMLTVLGAGGRAGGAG